MLKNDYNKELSAWVKPEVEKGTECSALSAGNGNKYKMQARTLNTWKIRVQPEVPRPYSNTIELARSKIF